MFRSLSIRNFRGFKNLKLEELAHFNLFIGRNNVGKTAILEAIFLLAGPTNPELPLRLNAFRGLEQVPPDPDSVWGWLFYEKNLNKEVELEFGTEGQKKRSLRIRLGERTEIPIKKKNAKKGKITFATASTVSVPSQLSMRYQSERGGEVRTTASVSPGGIAFERKPISIPSSVFVSARAGYSPENAQRFSELQEIGKEFGVLASLQILEPRLTKLSVLATPTGPLIHGDIGLGRMVPVPMMGEGLGRLLTLLVATTASRHGLLMVDEIDTGLHYSVMADVWTALAKTAREAEVQVFATTHSWECLKAAHESFSRNGPHDLRVHRLDRTEEGIAATTYDREMLGVALSSGMEIR